MRLIVPLGLAVVLTAAPAEAAELVALGAGASQNQIVRFDSAAPSAIEGPTAVTGLGAFTLVGLDRRPATGEIFAVGVSGSSVQLFLVQVATGVATPIGTAATVSVEGATSFGVDFDPVTDHLRVVNNLATDGVGGNANNFRMHPETGALVQVDADLDFSGLTGGNANAPVAALAHSNAVPGAAFSETYGIAAGGDVLVTHGGVGSAVLAEVGPLGIATSGNAGFDIGGAPEQGFAILESGGVSSLFVVNLATGAATGVATVGTGSLDFASVTVVGGTSLVTTSRLVCGDAPSEVAATASTGLFQPDAPGDAGACPALCKKWTSACRGLVAASRACWKAAGGRVAKLRTADCGTLTGDDRDACRDEVAADKAELADFLDGEAASGASTCSGDGLGSCLLGCG